MSDNEVRNSVTVSVKIKKPTVQYGSIEVMAPATLAMPDEATAQDVCFWCEFSEKYRYPDEDNRPARQHPEGY